MRSRWMRLNRSGTPGKAFTDTSVCRLIPPAGNCNKLLAASPQATGDSLSMSQRGGSIREFSSHSDGCRTGNRFRIMSCSKPVPRGPDVDMDVRYSWQQFTNTSPKNQRILIKSAVCRGGDVSVFLPRTIASGRVLLNASVVFCFVMTGTHQVCKVTQTDTREFCTLCIPLYPLCCYYTARVPYK